MKLLLLLLALAALAAAAEKPQKEGNFYVLNEKNFDNFLEEHKIALVVFYIDDCHICDTVSADLSLLKEKHQESHEHLTYAKIKGNDNQELMKKLELSHFPHIRIYFDKDYFSYFQDEFTRGQLDHFLNIHLNNRAEPTSVDSDEHFAHYNKQPLAIYLGYPQLNDKNRKIASNIQRVFPDIPVYIGKSGSSVDEKISGDKDTGYKLVLKRNFEDGNKILSGEDGASLNPGLLVRFINTYRKPVVDIMSLDISNKVFKYRLPALILFDKNYQTQSAKALRDAVLSTHFPGLTIASDLTEVNAGTVSGLADVHKGDFPALRILDFHAARFAVYKFIGDFTASNIEAFIKKYRNGELREHKKSERAFDNSNQRVLRLTRETADDVIQDTSKHVIVGFYASWCHSCDRVHPTLEKAARMVKNADDVVFARIDVDKNDLDYINMSQLPLVQLYKKNLKTQPVKFEGGINEEAVLDFLEVELDRDFSDRSIPEHLQKELNDQPKSVTDL